MEILDNKFEQKTTTNTLLSLLTPNEVNLAFECGICKLLLLQFSTKREGAQAHAFFNGWLVVVGYAVTQEPGNYM